MQPKKQNTISGGAYGDQVQKIKRSYTRTEDRIYRHFHLYQGITHSSFFTNFQILKKVRTFCLTFFRKSTTIFMERKNKYLFFKVRS